MNQQKPTYAIEIRNLFKQFGDQVVFNGFNLQVPENALIHISGESGSGKTTLLRCVAGLEKFSRGEILLHGAVVQSGKIFVKPHKRGIGMMFQDLVLFPHLTAMQNIDFVSKVRISNKAQRTEWNQYLLNRFKIGHKAGKYPHELSGGEKQRVALARALAHKPFVLLLDEPFSQLHDDMSVSIFNDLISMMVDQRITTVLVSHHQLQVSKMLSEDLPVEVLYVGI